MRAFLLCLRWLVLAISLALAPAAFAGDAPPDVAQDLDRARAALDKIQAAVSNEQTGADALAELRGDALEIQSRANSTADTLQPQLTAVQARLTELGKADETVAEDSDLARQRAQLEKSRDNFDAQLRLARLLSVEAGQAAEYISTTRRAQFQAQLGTRTVSILSASYWSEYHGDYPRDVSRLSVIGTDLKAALSNVGSWVWAGLLLAMAALFALRMWAGHRLFKITATRVPSGRLRRSVHALSIVGLGLAIPGLMAEAGHIALVWNGSLPNSIGALAGASVAMICFTGYVAGLGYALLSPHRPSWRLPPIANAVALKLQLFPLILAASMLFGWLIERLAGQINASLTTTVAVNVCITIVLGGTLAGGLIGYERARRAAHKDPETPDVAPRPFWVSSLRVLTWVALLVAALCLLTGYVAFASFVTKQLAWSLVVLSSTYLLAVLTEDVFSTLLAPAASNGQDDGPPIAQTRMREQAAVLLSGVTKVLLALLALLLLAAPFGAGPLELFQRLDQMRGGVAIGEVAIRPARVLQALIVLAFTLLAVRILKQWLATRYLPTTQLDPGMQSSASTLFGYTGVVLAISLALSAVGIGLERIAWVASALSVGIGFGLQAVVQNFVSGLILLAERPVKVGDWVALGGIEGDIVRVNVRATEIQMADRSTVIVPNSEFITKTVRNVTHANPLGLVQIKLPMPLVTNADQVRTLIQEAFLAHPNILETPAVGVHLDGVDAAGNLTFAASGYASSPRAAYGARSAILFDILGRMRDAGIDMYRPSAMVIREGPGDGVTPTAAGPSAGSATPPLPPVS